MKYGNCNVPQVCKSNRSQWYKYTNGTLDEESGKRLDGLGFEWQVETKNMTDSWIERGIELSSAEVYELQTFFNPSSVTSKLPTVSYIGIRNGILKQCLHTNCLPNTDVHTNAVSRKLWCTPCIIG